MSVDLRRVENAKTGMTEVAAEVQRLISDDQAERRARLIECQKDDPPDDAQILRFTG